MLWQVNPYSPVLFLAALLALTLAGMAFRRRAPGALTLGILSLSVAAWCSCYGLAWGLALTAAGQTAQDLSALGAAVVAPAFLYFTLQITRRLAAWRPPLRVGLAGLVAVQMFLIWFNPSQLWRGTVAETVTSSGLQLAVFPSGPAYWLFSVAIAYSLTIAGTLVLAREFWQVRGVYRRQYGWMLAGVAAALAASIVTESGWSPWPGLDLAPLALAVTCLMFGYALFRHRLLDLVPVARTTLVDNLTDAIVALDQQNRVIDINPAALRLLGWSGSWPLGEAGERVFFAWPGLVAHYAEVYAAHAEVNPRPDLTLDLRITPLYDQGRVLAGRLIVLRDVTESRRTQLELQTANQQLREQLAQIKDLQVQLQEQAVRDPLTGLYNRRYLEETLPREFMRCAREGQPLSLAFIDLDLFKGVNDAFGHDAGDRVLQALSTFLVGHTRGGDIVCRYGGEELVVVLPNAAAEVAGRRAEEWRLGTAQLQVLSDDGRPIRITISLGLAAFPTHGATIDEVLRAADKALYAAKAAGRNVVAMAPIQPPA